jgi:superfamily II DNA or RNA helicase
VTLADLLPSPPEPDAVYEAFESWAVDQGLTLYPAQEEALLEVVSGNHVILSTPTGSGKSMVAAGRSSGRCRRASAASTPRRSRRW